VSASAFVDVWQAVKRVEGWLSEDQARRLFERAAAVTPGGTIVEIGSFHGRSTIVLSLAAPSGATVVAIDPHAGSDRGPQEFTPDAARGEADHTTFLANLAAAGASERVRHIRLRSAAALELVTEPVDLLFVDGAHRLTPALDDITRYGALVVPGGTMLIHDAFSSIGVTLAIGARLVPSTQFTYAGRTRSLAEYRRAKAPRLSAGARASSAAAQLVQAPWFARNVAIKLAISAGQTGVARGLGHRAGDPWPY